MVLRQVTSFIRRLVMNFGFFLRLVMSFWFFLRLGISSKFVRSSSAPLHKFGVEIARRDLTRHEKAKIYMCRKTGIATQH